MNTDNTVFFYSLLHVQNIEQNKEEMLQIIPPKPSIRE